MPLLSFFRIRRTNISHLCLLLLADRVSRVVARLGHSDGGVDPRLAGVVVRHFAVVQLSVTLVELKRVLVALLLAMRLAATQLHFFVSRL